MDLDAALAFAAEHRNMVLVTLKRDGRAQLSNVIGAVGDGAVRVSITADRAKYANLRRDPRAAVHITRPDFGSYVVLEGDAELTQPATDPDAAQVDQLVDLYRSLVGEHPDWAEYRAAMVRERVVGPVALDVSQFVSCVADGGNRDAPGFEPGVGDPGGRFGGLPCQQEAVEAFLDQAFKLGLEIGKETVGGEIADRAGRAHSARGPILPPKISSRMILSVTSRRCSCRAECNASNSGNSVFSRNVRGAFTTSV